MLSFSTLFHPSSSVAQQSPSSPNTCMAKGGGFNPREILLRSTEAKGAGMSGWGKKLLTAAKKLQHEGSFQAIRSLKASLSFLMAPVCSALADRRLPDRQARAASCLCRRISSLAEQSNPLLSYSSISVTAAF